MATNNCTVNLGNIFPSCAAFQSLAGVRDFAYFFRRADITAVTRAADGTVTGITLPTGKVKKFQTKKFQNSGAVAVERSDIGKTRFGQTYIARQYYRSQADRNAMQSLILAEDVVWVSPNNDNQIEIYGLSLGLTVTTVAAGTGTQLGDDNTALLTFTGTEPALPPLFNTTATVSATSSSTATSASTTLAVVATTNIVVGQLINGAGIDPGTTVTAINGTNLTLSAPATVPASTALTLTLNDEAAFLANVAYLDALVS